MDAERPEPAHPVPEPDRVLPRGSFGESLLRDGGSILVVSDAWRPQVNGVVRTLGTVSAELERLGARVEVIGPDCFRTVPCPTYPDIRLAVLPRRRLGQLVRDARPDALHVATEGPLGMAARSLALRHGWRFTTSFHTRFAEYLHARTRLPVSIGYAWLRRFHAPSAATLVATPSLRDQLHARGFTGLQPWSRGVDLSAFAPEPRDPWDGLARPVFAYVGRVAVEKNIEAFLGLDLPGSKVVVGGGPQEASLRRRFPQARFTGARFGAELAASYAGADVMVFPSRTDTFGLVLLESLACGTPVAAFPVTGPLDVLDEGVSGAMDEDLAAACLRALRCRRDDCRLAAERHSWASCALQFAANLVPAGIHPWHPVDRNRGRRAGSTFFSEKKKQEDFLRRDFGSAGLPGRHAEKFFGSFFQERTCFLRARSPESVDALPARACLPS